MIKSILRYFLTLGVVCKAYLLAPFVKSYRAIPLLISRNSKVGELLGDVAEDRPAPGLPAVDPSGFLSIKDVKLPSLEMSDGNVSTYEMLLLGSLVKEHQPKRIFEIGTFNGLTTLTMALNAPDGTDIFTLDLPPDHSKTEFNLAQGEDKFTQGREAGYHFKSGTYPREQKMITQLYGDSAAFDFSPYKETVDFIFVDGSHAYDYVVSDTERAQTLFSGKGVILWHDYASRYFPDVQDALDHLQKEQAWLKDTSHIRNTALAMLIVR